MRALTGATLTLLASGCGGELRSPSQLDALRVIALVTETPEVRPTDPVEIRAVWFDPAGRTAAFSWKLCWERAGVDPLACADDREAEVAGAQGDRFVLDTDRLAARTSDTAIVVLRLAAGSDRVEAFRRIVVRTLGTLNRSPEIAEVTLVARDFRRVVSAGEILNAPRSGLRVEVSPARDAREMRADGPPETLTVSFLASGGRFDVPRVVDAETPQAQWVSGASEAVQMWVVLRDDRGGVSVRGWTLGPPP